MNAIFNPGHIVASSTHIFTLLILCLYFLFKFFLHLLFFAVVLIIVYFAVALTA